ncbi:hypothetical protein [Psychromonas ossibalaenae]|uniref:hypothetical protein n=1 Tax=Psychromonas ossibalaenae TaxID=444922 RepID=UPI00036EEBF1|nr:hypothetical protein [Psychromonas ossibalaenae]
MKNLHKKILCSLIFIFCPALAAVPITLNQQLNFHAPEQSMWTQGGPIGSIEESDRIGGAAGFEYTLRASSGTVSADFDGLLSIAYDNQLTGSTHTSVNLNFQGSPAAGSLSTFAGLNIDFDWFVDTHLLGIPVTGSGNVFSANYSLDIDEVFTPQLPQEFTFQLPPPWGSIDLTIPKVEQGSDSFGLLNPGVNLGLVDVGIDLAIEQTASFWANGLNGSILGRHRDTGYSRFMNFNLGTNEGINLGFDLPLDGYWDFYLADIMLENTFVNDIALTLDASLKVDIGVAQKTWYWDLLDQDIFNTDFALLFNSEHSSDKFSIFVTPAPNALSMTLAALLIVIFRKKHRLHINGS